MSARFDCLRSLTRVVRVGLVVVHVAGGDDQSPLVLLFFVTVNNHIRQRFTQAAEHIKVAGADGDWDYFQFRPKRLQERKLDLYRMFGSVRGAVLLQRREAAQQTSAHVRVSRYVAQRSLPSCIGP